MKKGLFLMSVSLYLAYWIGSLMLQHILFPDRFAPPGIDTHRAISYFIFLFLQKPQAFYNIVSLNTSFYFLFKCVQSSLLCALLLI